MTTLSIPFPFITHKQELRDRTDAAIWIESRGLSWITSSVSDKDETWSMLQKTASSTGFWKDSVIKESGLKTRE